MNRAWFLWSAATSFAVLVVGCQPFIWEREDRQRVDLGVASKPGVLADSAAYRDTIGSLTYLEGLSPMRVRGFGLVGGLGEDGSRDCPKNVYTQLVQMLYKQRRTSGRVVGIEDVPPEKLIDDTSTGVVLVQGEIPPAAVKGTRFDVSVMALPGSQTKSLRGGRLYPAELRIFRDVAPGAAVTGRALAHAAGPLFLNPFSEGEAATKSNPLQGVVLGGGIVTEDRRLRLVLLEPSHVWARRIQDRINAHFPGPQKVADAVSPSFIQLEVPAGYHGDEAHFLALVRNLYVSRDPRFEATRAHVLAEEILRPTAPHPRIALAFEGLGRAALPVLNDLYDHPKDYVSFHAAVAGLRLGDHIAGDAVTLHAQDPTGVFRFQAIRALAEAKKMGGAAVALRNLLADKDPRVQIAAYEALIKREDPTIHSTRVGGDNFVLNEIPASESKLVYVKRSGRRQIAVFGSDLKCIPPVFYRAPDGSLTITAESGDDMLTVLRVVAPSGTTSPPIPASFGLPELIKLLGNEAGVGLDGKVTGLGLDYGAVVRAMYALSKSRTLNTQFILEQPNVAELFGPPRRAGRPESEL
ncbi:MAG: flagellar basal body P-ring protein FlgI [Phycisphaerales bacterium]|nr:MAG: flagellar basal body P-ring protein FlgI [Phycisphaerales bacterium]